MSQDLISILVADDHAIVRKGLVALLNAKPYLNVIGEASNGEEAVTLARKLKPDIILLDLVMPVMDGISAIVEIKKNDPDAKILVLTSFAEDDMVLAAVKGGALGYLLKESKPRELLQAINDVYLGQPSIHPSLALKLVRELNEEREMPLSDEPLTGRELTVLRLLAQGLTNVEISEQIHISNRTVGTHVSNILGKLHLANRTQAALYALREGLADLT